MAGAHLSLLDVNHLQSPLVNSVKSQLQLIKHVLTNPSRQLSVKQAKLPKKQKHISTNMSIALTYEFAMNLNLNLLISGPPPPLGNTMIFEKTKNACSN